MDYEQAFCDLDTTGKKVHLVQFIPPHTQQITVVVTALAEPGVVCA